MLIKLAETLQRCHALEHTYFMNEVHKRLILVLKRLINIFNNVIQADLFVVIAKDIN